MKHLVPTGALALLLLAPVPATAQEAAGLAVATHEQHGEYLTDSEGRALYLFTRDTPGTADADPVIACTERCLVAWPPFYAAGDVQAGEGIDAAMIETVEHDGQDMVTYNGWPLYYYAQDQAPGDVTGQGVNDVWYLVSPAGEQIGG